MSPIIKKVRNWYGKFERPISSISLVGGFVFDALTLKRVDLFWENFWVVVHIAIVGICIILINLQENKEMDAKDPSKAHFWYINILQFIFGGLLSTFLVFYFRSAILAVTWPFLLILLLAFIANESLKHHYARLTFQISLFYLSLYSFAIFLMPVLFHRIGTDVFALSGIVSLIALWIFVASLGYFAKERFKKSRGLLILIVGGIFIATNVLYYFNLIPPIPLALKDGGVYHSLERDPATGNYIVTHEDTNWLSYFELHDTFHEVVGEPIYAYSAIFSPSSFSTDIVHVWQEYDPQTAQWMTISRIPLTALGGRDGGFRTYSMKNNIAPGEWRVNVETTGGQIIGRLRFNVELADTEPALQTEIKE